MHNCVAALRPNAFFFPRITTTACPSLQRKPLPLLPGSEQQLSRAWRLIDNDQTVAEPTVRFLGNDGIALLPVAFRGSQRFFPPHELLSSSFTDPQLHDVQACVTCCCGNAASGKLYQRDTHCSNAQNTIGSNHCDCFSHSGSFSCQNSSLRRFRRGGC